MSTDYAAETLLEAQTDEELPEANQIPVMPVCVTEKVITDEVTPQDYVTSTLVISTGTKNDHGLGIEELLPADPLRVLARIFSADQDIVICHSRAQASDPGNAAPAGGALTTPLSVSISGTNTNPGINGIIAQITAAQLAAVAPAPSLWAITWTVGLEGTVTAADADNMKICSPAGTSIGPSPARFNGVIGTYPQPGFQFLPPSQAGNSISVQAIAAASGAAAVYTAQIVATLLSPSAPLGVLNPSGALLLRGVERQIRTTRRLWVAATSPSLTRIAISVERRQP
jgi:hypothetical protein